MECSLVVAHAQDPISLLPVDLPSLSRFAAHRHRDLRNIIWKREYIPHQSAFAGRLFSVKDLIRALPIAAAAAAAVAFGKSFLHSSGDIAAAAAAGGGGGGGVAEEHAGLALAGWLIAANPTCCGRVAAVHTATCSSSTQK
jgi:hypothetical protein